MSGQPGPGGFVAPPTGQPTPGGSAPSPGFPPGFDPSTLPHDDKGAELRATIWTLCAFAAVFFFLRIYCRILKSRRLFYEDWVLFLSFLCLIFNGIMVQIQTGMGYGRHFYDIPIQNSNTMALYGLITISFIIMGQVWSKTSFAMTLLRITGPKAKIFVWFLIITINLFMTLGAIFFWVQCTPFSKAWTPLMQGGTCWDVNINISYGIFASSYSGFADLALAIVPWQVVMGLQLKTQEKLGVALAMSMGAFAGVAAFVKAAYLHTLASPDFVYEGKDLVVWGAVETAVTIIAASIPVLRVLLRDIASSRGYTKSRDGKPDNTGGSSAIKSHNSMGNRAFAEAAPSPASTGFHEEYPLAARQNPPFSAQKQQQPLPGRQYPPRAAAGPRRGRYDEEAAESFEMTWQGGPERKIYVR